MNDKRKFYILTICIVLLSINLRPSLTSISPVLDSIIKKFNLSTVSISLLTTLPLLMLGLFSAFVPNINRIFGTKKITIFGLVILSICMFLRTLNSVYFLFLGTILLGISLSILNVVLPGIIKNNFGNKSGIMVSVYTTVMGMFAAAAPGVTSFLVFYKSIAWESSMYIWIIISVSTICVCALTNFGDEIYSKQEIKYKRTNSIWKSTLAWEISLFMGLQSFLFYSLATWLPVILVSKGYSHNDAGVLLTLMGLTGLPTTFITPIIANKMNNQKYLIILVTITYIIGLSGLYLPANNYIIFFITLVGFAQGASISLSYAFFGLKTKNAKLTTDISGMAQSTGYCLASLGPFVLGIMKCILVDWSQTILILVIVCLLMFIIGMKASEDKYI